jgi:hypothetical protein
MMRFAAVEKMILAVSIPVSFLITPAQQYKKQISFRILDLNWKCVQNTDPGPKEEKNRDKGRKKKSNRN